MKKVKFVIEYMDGKKVVAQDEYDATSDGKFVYTDKFKIAIRKTAPLVDMSNGNRVRGIRLDHKCDIRKMNAFVWF